MSDVITDRYPIKEKEATVLAAFQLRAMERTMSDFNTRIGDFMPASNFVNDRNKADPNLVALMSRMVQEHYNQVRSISFVVHSNCS